MALTPIGKRLFDDIEPMYRGLYEGMDRARLAARGKTGVLRVGSIAVNLHDFRELFEPIVLAVGATHRLAGRTSVSYEDLADETVMGGARPDYWREILVPVRTPSGRLIPIGPSVSNFQEMIPILVTGEAVSPVQAQAARYYARPDIAYVPIHDAPPARWALIWRTGSETELIRSFASNARGLHPVE
ncbi:LysR substrate-binding domain-containing protein [Micromonospora sp. DT15]|uniref:LysR substrate-binding domain-containing protein n=1 Tax=Micromonospora sp. DT15 TaxID=3393445 RepID=UPI003CE867FF